MIAFLLVLFFFGFSYADGKVYPIAERDAIEEIEALSKKSESVIKDEIEKSKERFLNSSGLSLKKSTKSYSYYVDPTYVLDRDIVYYDESSKQWKVLYPKGYKFNPLDYIVAPAPDIVVFNPCDKSELSFVESLVKSNPLNYMLVSTGCPIKNIKSNFQVFILTSELKDKLKLKETVSVATIDRQKKMILVKVYSVGGR